MKDIPDAPVLEMTKGYIEFNNVCFHYQPEKPILKNVSFVVPPGNTVALVSWNISSKLYNYVIGTSLAICIIMLLAHHLQSVELCYWQRTSKLYHVIGTSLAICIIMLLAHHLQSVELCYWQRSSKLYHYVIGISLTIYH